MRTSIHTALVFVACSLGVAHAASDQPFGLHETTIEDIHRVIRSGEITCKQIVEGYVARARAYNGVCTKLVTPTGAKVAANPAPCEPAYH